MKCPRCGFEFQTGTACPKCGAVVPNTPNDTQTPNEKASRPDKLRFLTACSAVVIAFCVLATCVTVGIVSLVRLDKTMQRDQTIDKITNAVNLVMDSYGEEKIRSIVSDFINRDKTGVPEAADKPQTDGKTRDLGEAFDFGGGTVVLKSAKVASPSLTFDDTRQQVAVTAEITNNTEKTQSYQMPKPVLDGGAQWQYSEASREVKDDGYLELNPGETVTAVVYYSLPKDSKTLTGTVAVNYKTDDDKSESAASAYTIELT